jgi:hypothetical protein
MMCRYEGDALDASIQAQGSHAKVIPHPDGQIQDMIEFGNYPLGGVLTSICVKNHFEMQFLM